MVTTAPIYGDLGGALSWHNGAHFRKRAGDDGTGSGRVPNWAAQFGLPRQ